MNPGVRAAVESAEAQGLVVTAPLLLQETKNTVVWLRPQPVVAKVATRPDADPGLRREHALAIELHAAGARTASPAVGLDPTRHEESGFLVTFWERVEGQPRAEVESEALAESLRLLHQGLSKTETPLPSFRLALDHARRALDDDAETGEVAPADRSFLRDVLDEAPVLPDGDRRLHGQPHDANRLVAGGSITWIDFEDACVGPLEWDLAFQPPEVAILFEEADAPALSRLRRLNSARVATWCLAATSFPEMQRHGQMHLGFLRQQ